MYISLIVCSFEDVIYFQGHLRFKISSKLRN